MLAVSSAKTRPPRQCNAGCLKLVEQGGLFVLAEMRSFVQHEICRDSPWAPYLLFWRPISLLCAAGHEEDSLCANVVVTVE